MGIEASIIERPKLDIGPLALDSAIVDYSLNLKGLGIVKRIYMSDFIKGKKDGAYGVVVWTVLTSQATEGDLPKVTVKKIHHYSRLLREEIAEFGIPIEVHTTFVRPEREQALKDLLERKKISYDFAS